MGDEELSKKVEPEATIDLVNAKSPSLKTLFLPDPQDLTTQKVLDPEDDVKSEDVIDKETVLARVEKEKTLALIKAWEESEKSKAENKAYKKLSCIEAWENAKKANVEAYLMEIEEVYEKKKAVYAEKVNNKKAEIHKAAQEKIASIEAKRVEEALKVKEMAEKFRSTGFAPRRLFGCFGY